MFSKKELLPLLDFGKVDSESEEALDKIFIQTEDFDKFLNKDTSVILGAKGAGKSALFRLFTVFEESARKRSGHALNNVYVIPGTGFKDMQTMDCDALYEKMRDGRFNFQSAWKLYLSQKIVHELFKANIICGPLSKSLLIRVKKLKDNRLFGLLGRLVSFAIADTPQIDELSFKDVSISLTKNKKIEALEILKEVDCYLARNNKTVWILLDKVDEMFAESYGDRKRCIEGLFLTLIDFISRYTSIKIKIFLRTDIWESLSFVNKSHITDKVINLNWELGDLCALLVNRACLNEGIRKYILNKTKLNNIVQDDKACFYAIFDQRAYPGPREAPTLNYMIDRTTDGLGGVYPRELINFCNFSRNIEMGDVKDYKGADTSSLISGSSVRAAFQLVSKTKVGSYLSEFEWLKQHFLRFEGATKAEFSKEELYDLMDGLEPSREEMLRQLYETGVLKPDSSVVTAANSFEIPRLFRIGLGIVTSGRP